MSPPGGYWFVISQIVFSWRWFVKPPRAFFDVRFDGSRTPVSG